MREVCFDTFVMWGSGRGEARTGCGSGVCLDFGEFAVEDRRSNEPCGLEGSCFAGLRTCPPDVTGEGKAEWEASEPSWRQLHVVTLHESYRARCRTHAAYHASPQTSPKAASTRHVVRRIKLRLQQRIEYEHEKAKYARQHSHEGQRGRADGGVPQRTHLRPSVYIVDHVLRW